MRCALLTVKTHLATATHERYSSERATASITTHQLVVIFFFISLINASDDQPHRGGRSSDRNAFQFLRCYAMLSIKFPERYDVMCVHCVAIPNSISFGQSALISCEHTTKTHTQFRYKLPFARFTPESTLTHTVAIAGSALLNILQHKSVDKNTAVFRSPRSV